MKIALNNVGKRFNHEWIFRHCNYTFETGRAYAVTGPNGSGKSTLLQVISGALTHNEGNIEVSINGAKTANDILYRSIAIAAPYLELIEEMTANELLAFHAKFKPLLLPAENILEAVGLANAANKQLRYFSSGMKQRLKLAQAFFSDTSVLLLDEPATNLDEDGIALYHRLINTYTANRIVIVSSNDKQEYGFCEEVISISTYK